jgi:hypothetical protein
VADREIKAKLRVEMAPDEKRKLDDLAKATRGAADAQREYAGAMKQTAAAAKDTAAAVDRLAAHPGAAKIGLTRDVLARMPAAALSDMARQLGAGGPAAPGGGAGGGGIFSAAGNFFNRGGGIFGAAPVNWSPYQSPGPQPPPGPPPTAPWGRPVLGGNISDTAHMAFAQSADQRARAAARLGGLGDFDLTPGGPTRPSPWWNPALTSRATDARVAGLAGRAAGPAAAAYGGVKYTEAAAGSMFAAQRVADTGGTGEEGLRAAIESNWALRNSQFGMALSFHDEITGRGYKLDKNQREQALRRVDIAGEERVRRQQNQYDIEVGRQTRSVQAQGQIGPLATVGQFDRSTVGGDIAFQEASRLQGARNQAEQAKVDYEASVVHAGDLTRGREAIGRRRHDLEGQERAFGLAAGRAEGPERDRLLKLEADAREKLKLALEEEQKIVGQEKQARLDSVQALKAQRDAQLQVTQAELQNLQARERVAAGQAQGLGQMIPFERAAAVQGAMMVKEMGWDAASPEMRAHLRSVAPRTAEKMAEEAGKNSPEAELLRQQFPEEHRDRLDDIRKKAQDKQDEVQVQMRVNVEEIKKATKEAMEAPDLQEAIRSLIRMEIAAAKREIVKGLQEGNIARPGGRGN